MSHQRLLFSILSVCVFLFFCLSVCQSVSVCLSLSVSLLHHSLFFCLPVDLSIYLSVSLFLSLFVSLTFLPQQINMQKMADLPERYGFRLTLRPHEFTMSEIVSFWIRGEQRSERNNFMLYCSSYFVMSNAMQAHLIKTVHQRCISFIYQNLMQSS